MRSMRSMRSMGWVISLACLGGACGKKAAPAKDDGATSRDAPAIDAAPVPACTPTSGLNVSTVKLGTVNGGATLATSPPNDPRLFVLEQEGRIRIFKNGQLLPTPFLDISGNTGGPVVAGGEQGLLGLAFDPNYATNGTFYVDYTGTNPNTADTANPWVDVVVRYQVSTTNPDVANPATAQLVLSIPDFATNHNAGMIEFGSDNDLYITTGDGGQANDPHLNGQNPNALLAKMLRIDVEHPNPPTQYSIPADNPYASGGAGSGSGAPEVYLLGLRNPWRWSFDRGTGDMWIADVGQNLIEELDVLPAGQQAGKNLGWSMWEGSGSQSCFGNYPCSTTGMTFPLLTHTHNPDGWDAIIGGQVYRGTCFPDLVGWYFFTDNVKAGLTRAQLITAGGSLALQAIDMTGTWPPSPSSIHADASGELYETTTSGDVYHIVAGP